MTIEQRLAALEGLFNNQTPQRFPGGMTRTSQLSPLDLVMVGSNADGTSKVATVNQIGGIVAAIGSNGYRGPALANTNPGLPTKPEYWSAKAGVTYPNFKDDNGNGLIIPTKIGDDPVLSAALAFNGTSWVAEYSAVAIPLVDYAKSADIESEFVKAKLVGKNRLDAFSNLIAGEAYWNDGAGLIRKDTYVANFLRTPLLPMESGKKYSYSGYMDAGYMAYVHFFNIDKKYIGFHDPAGQIVSSYFSFQFTSPVGTAYFGTNVRTIQNTDLSTLQVELGNVNTSVDAYINQFTEPLRAIDLDSVITKNEVGLVENIFNPLDVQKNKDIKNTDNGEIVNGSRNVIQIDVKSNTKYFFKILDANSFLRLNFYSALGIFLEPSVEFDGGYLEFNTPPATAFIRISYDNWGDQIRIMLQEGSSTPFIPFGKPKLIDSKKINDAFRFKTSSENLFDKSYRLLGTFLSYTGVMNSGLTPKNQYSVNVFRDVKANTVYTLSGKYPNDTTNGLAFIAVGFVDMSGNILSYLSFPDIGGLPARGAFPIKFTTPVNCVTLYISTMSDGIDRTKDYVLNEGTDIFDRKSEFSIHVGKRFVFLGDSLTWMNIHQPLIADKLGFHYYNNGVPGGLVTPGYENIVPDGIRRASFVERIQNLEIFNADRLVIFGGANDFGYGAKLGTIADEINPTFTAGFVDQSSVVGASFYGSLKYILRVAQQKAPTAKIYLANYHYFDSTPGQYDLKKVYADAVVEVGKSNGIPVLNMFENSGINPFNVEYYTTDKIHLNANGGKLFAEKYIPFLNS